MDLSELYVESHVMVGYVAAGQNVIPPNWKPPAYPAGRDHQKDPENGCRRFDLIVAPHVGRAASEFACSGPRGSPSLDVVDDTTNIAIAATRRPPADFYKAELSTGTMPARTIAKLSTFHSVTYSGVL